ncbi:hypothetical protein ACFWYW_44400 [Nonomuraea sp. NPDC059023]|uniref:hypothetical protein n=1 Tax=unclassified Nonomuraea TaxID=2593643 RepID=UPI0036B774BE
MGPDAGIDWIVFEWDERTLGLGPVRSSLPDTRIWNHVLGPWLDPGPAPGVSICRLVVEGRVAVLARTRTGGSDSRRTIRVHVYLGGPAAHPSAMPNVRQTLALAPGWEALVPADSAPLDLAQLLAPYTEAAAELDWQAQAEAQALAPIVAEVLRGRGQPLSVASRGPAIAQLWGLVDVLDLVLGRYPGTFSTYESDDLKRGAEVIFLRQWPGPSSRASHRRRVDLRQPDEGSTYNEIAHMIARAYADGELEGLVKRLRITDGMPMEERIELLAHFPARSGAQDPPAPRTPISSGSMPLPKALPEPYSFAARDVFEVFLEELAEATSAGQVEDILRDVRDWAAARRPADVRSRLPALIPELERLLPDYQVNAVLRDLLDQRPPIEPARSSWTHRQWLILAVMLTIVLAFQVAEIVLR